MGKKKGRKAQPSAAATADASPSRAGDASGPAAPAPAEVPSDSRTAEEGPPGACGTDELADELSAQGDPLLGQAEVESAPGEKSFAPIGGPEGSGSQSAATSAATTPAATPVPQAAADWAAAFAASIEPAAPEVLSVLTEGALGLHQPTIDTINQQLSEVTFVVALCRCG